MKAGFVAGVAREFEFVVTEDMCPAFDGVVVHPVCATWTLVYQMEIAARKVLIDFLEPHEEGIGAHVSADHKAPAPIGRTLRVRAELVDPNPRWIVCSVTVKDGERLIAVGEQVQVVMERETLQRIIERS